MKRIFMFLSVFTLIFILTACDDVCVGPDCITGESGGGGTTTDSIINYTHVDGHGAETVKQAHILFEFEALEFVKYQLSFLSCTCRDLNVNYWQVAYVEISKEDGSIRFISFGKDPEGHYTGGMWGDSNPTPAGITLEDFENDFFPWLVGKNSADFEGITVFKNDSYHDIQNTTNIPEQDLIDEFAGSSVSTNSMIRALTALLEYHAENYS